MVKTDNMVCVSQKGCFRHLLYFKTLLSFTDCTMMIKKCKCKFINSFNALSRKDICMRNICFAALCKILSHRWRCVGCIVLSMMYWFEENVMGFSLKRIYIICHLFKAFESGMRLLSSTDQGKAYCKNGFWRSAFYCFRHKEEIWFNSLPIPCLWSGFVKSL